MDAANEEIVKFFAKYGFLRVIPEGLRIFLPKASLKAGAEIPLG